MAVLIASAQPPAMATTLTRDLPTATCPPNSDDSLTLTSGSQCIAESAMTTRGWVASYCITDGRALVPDAKYTIGDCKDGGIQAEAIAQARAIRQLNTRGVYGDSAAPGITPNLQWETVIPGGGRPDLVLYDRNNPSGDVGIVEMKGTWFGGLAAAQSDLTSYLQAWPSTASGRDVVPYNFAGGFNDTFEVTFGPCKYYPDKTSGYLYNTHSVPGAPGALVIERTLKSCPDSNPETAGQDAYQGTIGVDANANGNDDFWDYIAAHPELWTAAGEIPRLVYELQKPLKVYLTRDAIAAIEEGVEAGGVDAWTEIVAGLSDVAASSAELIAAGEATELGMTAAELAAAGLLAEAGFITLPVALVAAAVVAVVLIVIWAAMHWNVFGDPHLATLDRLSYDLQSVGEFHLLRIPSQGIDIQARFTPMGSTISTIDSVAFTLNGSQIEIHRDGTALVNGEPVPASQQWLDFGQGASLMRKDNRFIAVFPSGLKLALGGMSFGIDLSTGVPTEGLLGNNDGLAANDLVTASGEVLSKPSATVLHGRYADSWRVSDADSLFSYAENKSTASYTDLAFPSNIVTLGDFAPSDLNAAATICNDKGVVDGPQFEACVLDVAMTGDSAYATAAAAVTDFLQDPAAHSVDAAGALLENYDDAIPSNLKPLSVWSIGGTDAAGPILDSSGYSFSVPTLPNHSDATVAFDVYAVGLNSGNAQNQSMTVDVEGMPVSKVAFTPTSASVTSGAAQITPLGHGQTPQGADYDRYRVSLHGEHLSDQLRVSLALSGFRGLLGTSIAIDDLAVNVTVVPPQIFDVSLASPVTISDQAPAAGAGNLENKASQDQYRFSANAGDSIYVDVQSCPGTYYLNWQLVDDATGASKGSGGCGDGQVNNLTAGTYRLITTVSSGHTGAYSLQMFTVPAAQTFDVSLASPVTISDQAPAAGAGNLETKASVDQYRFSANAGESIYVDVRSCPGTYYLNWKLVDDATGVQWGSGGCSDGQLDNLAAGTYRLITSVSNERTGAYSFQLFTVPPAQTFDVSLISPVNIADQAPAAGAGNLETKASVDQYRFSANAGDSVYVDVQSCPGTYYLSWRLVDDATGAQKGSGGCGDGQVNNLTAGTYRLITSVSGERTGAYAMRLFLVDPPQVFDVSVSSPVTISDQAPAAGAGNLETKASQDQYRFSVNAGDSIYVDVQSCPGTYYLNWKLVDDATGAQKGSGGCGDGQVNNLPAGTYRLITSVSGEQTGAYSLQMFKVPPAQTFEISLASPVAISDQAPAAGAGNLETKASVDQYRFSVNAGDSVYVDVLTCPGTYYLNWKLVDDTTGASKGSGGCGDGQVNNLPAGAYRLITSVSGERVGAYSLQLSLVAAPQVFDVSVSSPVTISDQAPAAGAGNLETKSSVDQYRFSVNAGDSIYVDILNCPGTYYLNWKLVDDTTGASKGSGGCGDGQVNNLPAGAYRLITSVSNEQTGAYSLQMFKVPPAQVFDVSLASPLSISNQVPAAGAGNLETKASQDQYRFTVAAGQAPYVDILTCPGTYYLNWQLVDDATGASKGSGGCGDGQINNLPAGTYRLILSVSNERTGAYSLQLSLVATPQVFDVSLASPVNISDQAPAAGAGNLETKSSQDQYRFSVNAGDSIYLDIISCPGTYYLNWQLIEDATGASKGSGGCGDGQVNNLTAGAYRLILSVSNERTGAYSLQMFKVPPAQTFDVSLTSPANISDQAPAAGAGNLETKASVDQYRFNVNAGDSVYVDLLTCPGTYYLSWRLVDDVTGASKGSGGCGDGQVNNLPAGTYRLITNVSNERTGAYSLQMFKVPPAQTFDVSLATPANVSDQAPAAGAGNLETKASVDQYRFPVSAGDSVYVDVLTCPGTYYLSWRLVDDVTGAQKGSGGCGDGQVNNLTAGTYRLITSVSNEQTGAYSLQMFTVPPAQTFDVSLASPANVSDQAPAAGAGNLETKASVDQYRFTVSAGDSVYVDMLTCPGTYYLNWRLVDDVTGAQKGSGGCGDGQVNNLPAGTYRLITSVSNERTGAYSFQLFTVPAAQTFDVSLASPVNVSDQAPAAGAGNLETKASVDQYRFGVNAGDSVYLDIIDCPGTYYLNWKIVDDVSGAQKGSGGCGDGQVNNLTAGTYRLITSVSNERTGAYSFQLFKVPPAQTFDVSLSSPVTITDQAPTAGAGNLETKASVDQYRFTLTAGQTAYVDVLSCPGSYYLNWRLVDDATGAQKGSGGCGNGQVANLPAGTYRVIVTPSSERIGAYSVRLRTA